MCVTNIYVDRYPDGQALTFRQTSICQYGLPGRPCPSHSTIENPVRKINFGEPTTEHMLTRQFNPPQPRPHTPPRSPASHHRHSSSESGNHRRHSKRMASPLRPTRQHRKERIVIVDSPPTPRTPPQLYNQIFTAPSSPASPRFRTHERERGRPVIVDERPLRRVPSVGAVVSDRPRRSHSIDRNRHVAWDSPSSSHTSFNSRLRLEEEEIERQRLREIERKLRLKDIEAAERRREAQIKEAEIERRVQKELEEKRKKEAWMKAQDEEIRRRPAVPLAPMPPSRRQQRPVVTVVDQADMLPVMMGGLAVKEKVRKEEDEEEAMKRRLRERQLPKRRFSVGPGYRRHRVAYDDGLYRWE
ncbi:hypothetical protein G7Y89_g14819 [Cudoniella acicularis]|uniref:Uncharacterized protein n=1 Tax=Cudoniella acicularis TaxID=354080 RepID=A0A8H4QXJ1_9HELO|nr:hypothetical protein G7Y89_g14819 [Cudoniella acicularis]